MPDAPSEVQEDDWQYTQEAVNGPLVVGAAMVPLADAEKLATALAEIKRTAAIEAPPVSDEVPAKAWKIAFDALNIWRAAYPREETT